MNKRDEHLDKLVDEVVKATSASQRRVKAVAESPFLFRRIRVRIEQEEKSDNSIFNFWSDLFVSFKLATKVTAAVALLVIFAFILMPKSSTSGVANAQTPTPVLDELANDDVFAEAVGLPPSARFPNEVKK